MSEQSSVEWIFSQLPDEYTTTRSGFDVYQQAKAMHKEEIIKAYETGLDAYYDLNLPSIAEQYYEQTYGGNK